MNARALACVLAAALVAASFHVAHAQGVDFGGAVLALEDDDDAVGFAVGKPGTTAGCGEPPSTSLSVWLDGRNIDGSNNATLANNDPVTTWQDTGSIGDDPTQAVAGSKPTYIASCINSKACVRFDGGDSLVATTAANFTFLNSGVDYTVYIVWVASTANPNALYVLAGTQASLSSTSRGASFFYDDRAGSSREDKLMWYVSNGTVFNVNLVAADDSYPQRFWHTGVYKLDDNGGAGADAFPYVDGVATTTASASGSYSASAPVGALAVGAGPTAGSPMTGDIAQLLIYAAAHDDTTRGTVEDWIDCTYGTMPVTP